MRRFGLSMLAVVGALGISVMAANEKPSAAMMEVMKANAATNGMANKAVKANDYAVLLEAAGTYRANFAYIDAFFTHKKADAGATLAQSGMKGAMALEAAATAKDAAGVAKAMAAVTGTCGGCHKQFRETLADKSYEIKLP